MLTKKARSCSHTSARASGSAYSTANTAEPHPGCHALCRSICSCPPQPFADNAGGRLSCCSAEQNREDRCHALNRRIETHTLFTAARAPTPRYLSLAQTVRTGVPIACRFTEDIIYHDPLFPQHHQSQKKQEFLARNGQPCSLSRHVHYLETGIFLSVLLSKVGAMRNHTSVAIEPPTTPPAGRGCVHCETAVGVCRGTFFSRVDLPYQ